MRHRLTPVVLAGALVAPALSQKVNYDEAEVPEYELPALLQDRSGAAVTDPEGWQKRRAEIMALLREHMFGVVPDTAVSWRARTMERGIALGGKAVRKQVTLTAAVGERRLDLHLLIYQPAAAKQPPPVFLGLNFNGNHAISKDPRIRLSTAWMRNARAYNNKDNRATEASRGTQARRWPVDLLVERGCALATVYCGDLDPDFDDGFENGAHGLMGPAERDASSWGCIAAWAWGLSRVLDHLETDSELDASRCVVVGHSRLGKTSLWAGACDPRFAMVVSNNSGCGGAALSRRRFGETLERINTRFPHWFCKAFHRFNDKEDELPLDQHMLIAAIAPRPVLVCSATGDRWADPLGEFLAVQAAAPVYALFGHGVPGARPTPDSHAGLESRAGYFLRTGKHDMTVADWQAWLRFAAQHGVIPPPG